MNNERNEIENVFSLGGGELSDVVWAGHRYWYEGAPDYLGTADLPDLYACGVEYRTVVTCLLYAGRTGYVAPKGWEVVSTFVSSGEADC